MVEVREVITATDPGFPILEARSLFQYTFNELLMTIRLHTVVASSYQLISFQSASVPCHLRGQCIEHLFLFCLVNVLYGRPESSLGGLLKELHPRTPGAPPALFSLHEQ